ncbi:MarR family transcriptional regulator [Betaproteobacteria bacterium SCN1]|jgi:DNA-binding MarR family transcriptional regulator|nr:MarR family transcriptional regulator [Betaproteobacteria bacterium SCN1]MBN8759592.1 MarR family transcriptional regulator [Thiobacillus sp.]ODU89695.1 MAG: MarR family transcriptional regulator [Thiobacillus sp. SCN 65-179]OJW37623.1 MAG: MarR family transcriptional regulator [Thiobacillus sp. 65-69]
MSSFSEFLPTVQALVQCYQAFEACSDSHIRTLGLTPPQFDIVATLGNTPGMTSKELGEKTLITKGTLTGVIDRLVERGWVERAAHDRDRRCQIVRLTSAGEAVFARVFPAHMEYMATHFAGVAAADHKRWQGALHALRDQLKKERT